MEYFMRTKLENWSCSVCSGKITSRAIRGSFNISKGSWIDFTRCLWWIGCILWHLSFFTRTSRSKCRLCFRFLPREDLLGCRVLSQYGLLSSSVLTLQGDRLAIVNRSQEMLLKALDNLAIGQSCKSALTCLRLMYAMGFALGIKTRYQERSGIGRFSVVIKRSCLRLWLKITWLSAMPRPNYKQIYSWDMHT